jgi:hypothetical protein
MKQADFISKSDIPDPSLEFENIRKVGIEEIQRLAGNQWTDYNIHDPGITILEQLCYAITELGYKTAFDIKDLLASQQVDPSPGSTFFTASQILEGKPVTVKDFRKLLIDRVAFLRDIWFEPLNLDKGSNHIKGLYRVLVMASPKLSRGAESVVNEGKRLLMENTVKCLEKYSNLGEAFDEISILEEVGIIVSGEIDLDKEANVEKTYAEILYNIRSFISSPIKFYSLEDMVKMGFSVEDIFDGPRLKNGFILDEELKERRKELMTSHLVDIISRVNGVAKVRRLKIEKVSGEDSNVNYYGSVPEQWHEGNADEKTFMDEGVSIDSNKVAVMADLMLPYHTGYRQTLHFYQNYEEVNLFSKKVIRYFRQIEKESNIDYSDYFKVANDIPLKEGHYRPVSGYYSIQEHFPAIYSLGSKGITSSAGTVRINQVKQLKSYLLIFEQILTNYLAQLTNFSRLFSLDENLSQSYFAGSLETVPFVRDLLVELKDQDLNEKELEQTTREISRKALAAIDNFNDRRHKVLDHLLARFGEQVSSFGFERFNYYYDEETLQRVKISSKINYLKELTYLSSNKARSFNSLEPFWCEHEDKDLSLGVENVSFLEKKTRIKLGIPMHNIKIAAYLEDRIPSWKPAESFHLEGLVDRLTVSDRLDHNQLSLRSVDNPVLFKEEFDPGIEIDSELLRRGIWADNYILVSFPGEKSTQLAAFSRNLNTKSLSNEAKNDIMERLSELSQDLSLKPDFLRFMVKDENRPALLLEFEKMSDDGYNPVPRNVWSILRDMETREEAEKYIQSMTNHLAYFNINMEGMYLVDHIELRPRNKPGLRTPDTDAAFYSFCITVIFPSWPSRFADPEFRKFMEAALREDAPSHIGIDFYYLDVKELKEFEEIYSLWLEQLRIHSEDNINELNSSAHELSVFIKSLGQPDHGKYQRINNLPDA